MMFISAKDGRDGHSVIYSDALGEDYEYYGGTRSWRNSNPGNIRLSNFTVAQGSIGEAGNFAVFPDRETGFAAILALFKTSAYSSLSIKNAIERYAPPTENDTSSYQNNIKEYTGLDIDRIVSSLSDAELHQMGVAIQKIEGWKPGAIAKINAGVSNA
jgi:hypothetical protein